MKSTTRQKFSTLLAVSLLSLLIIGAGVANAQGFGRGQGRGMGGDFDGPRSEMRLERMAAFLELTEAQVVSITAIRDENRAKGLQLQKEMMVLRNEKQGEMMKDDPSEKTLLALNEKMGALRTKLSAQRITGRLAIREQLTDEQRDQMLLMGGFDGSGRGRGAKGGCFGGQGQGGRFNNNCYDGPGRGYRGNGQGRGFSQ